MIEIFNRLVSRADYHKQITIIDRRLELSSSDPDLLALMTGRLKQGELRDEEDITAEAHCLVEYNTTVSDWREKLPPTPTRLIDQPEIGRAAIYQTGREVIMALDEGQRVLFHSGSGRMVCLLEPPPPDLAPGQEQNLFNLTNIILSEVLALSGKIFVHAGAVGRNNRCQLWTGRGGAGKTTQVLSLVAQGWDFYGDDQVILGRGRDGLWRVWPFWRPPRVTAETCRLLPELFALGEDFKPGAKLGFSMEKLFGARRPGPGILESIFLLTGEGSRTSRRLDPAEAFELVAPGFMHFLWAGHALTVMEAVMELVSDLPVTLIPRARLEEAKSVESGLPSGVFKEFDR